MLSKSLKLSFTREVEIIASTLQPPSTVHTFTFTLPAATSAVGHSRTDLRASVYSNVTTNNGTEYANDPMLIARPSSTYLGPPLTPAAQEALAAESAQATTYHGVCLTVWSHADEERSAAIRRTVEKQIGARRGEVIPPVPSLPHLREAAKGGGAVSKKSESSVVRSRSRGPWSGTDGETDAETDAGAMSESDWEGNRRDRDAVGESTLFLPGDTVCLDPQCSSQDTDELIRRCSGSPTRSPWSRATRSTTSCVTISLSRGLVSPRMCNLTVRRSRFFVIDHDKWTHTSAASAPNLQDPLLCGTQSGRHHQDRRESQGRRGNARDDLPHAGRSRFWQGPRRCQRTFLQLLPAPFDLAAAKACFWLLRGAIG